MNYSSSNYRVARVDAGDEVAMIEIGLGSRHNPLRTEDWRHLSRLADMIAEDDDIRAVVIKGRGTSFCSGADIREWSGSDAKQVDDSFSAMEAALTSIEEIPVPVIAQMRGIAAGAGFQLALACDLRLASKTALVGMPVVRLGILVSPMFASRISSIAGHAVAREMFFTGRLFTAGDALRLGLVMLTVDDEELDEATEAIVRTVLQYSPDALRTAKHAVDANVRFVREAAQNDSEGHSFYGEEFGAAVAKFLGASAGLASSRDSRSAQLLKNNLGSVL